MFLGNVNRELLVAVIAAWSHLTIDVLSMQQRAFFLVTGIWSLPRGAGR